MDGIRLTIEARQAIANVTALREGLVALDKTVHASVKGISDIGDDFNSLTGSAKNASASLAGVGASMGAV